MATSKSLSEKVKALEEQLARLEKDYKYLYDYLDSNSERVFILAKHDKGYREICRSGEQTAKDETTRGWEIKDWTIGYTLKKKLRD